MSPSAPPLSFSVLGRLEVHREGRVVELGGRRQRHVLAVLLAARGRHVSTERLLEEAWGEPPEAGRRTLAAHVSRLRTALDGADLLRFEADGYVLRTQGHAVDAELFREGVQRARTAARTGSSERLLHLDAALALWRGRAYEDVSTVSSAAEGRQLEDLRSAALVDRAEALLAAGRPDDAAADLAPLVDADPLQEHVVGLLAVALHRSGRTGAARELVASLRSRLLEEYGLDPGPELLALEQQLHTAAPWLALAVDDSTAAPAPSLPPLPLSRLVGRAALLAALPAARLLTLVGPAGAGKTRLALEVVHTAAAPRRGWVAVEGLPDGELLDQAVAEALQVVSEPGRPARDGVIGALGAADALLVLDNCEVLREPVAELAATLLAACPGLRLLVTSREPLGIPGEQLVDVPPLPVEAPGDCDGAAVELFLERATDLRPGWEPDAEERAAVRTICAELDGLPLALELAAARTRTLDTVEIAAALHELPELLSAPGAGLAPHHGTLDAALRWSYDLLSHPEQEHFRALAVFEGGFDLRAAREVLRSPAPAVARLVRGSLVAVERRAPSWRYRMLSSLQSFARRSTGDDEALEWSRRHLRWVAALAAEAAGQLRGPDAAAWLDRLDLERGNVRAAVRTALALGEAGTALTVAADLAWFWYRRGLTAEGTALLEAALERTTAHQPERGRALLGLSLLQYLQGDAAAGAGNAVQAVGLLRDRSDAEALMTAESTAGWLVALTGDLPGARAHAERSLQLARASAAPGAEAEALMVLGQISRFDRSPEEAEELLVQSVRLAAASGHDWVAASSGWVAAKVALASGRPEAALERARPAVLRLVQEGDAPAVLAFALVVAAALAGVGRGREGTRLAAAAAEEGVRIGYDPARMDPLDSGWLRAAVFGSTDAQTRRAVVDEVRGWSPDRVHEVLLEALAAS